MASALRLVELGSLAGQGSYLVGGQERNGRARSTLSWTGVLLISGVLGILSILAGALGSPYGGHALNPGRGVLWVEYLSAWLGAVWAWVGLSFVIGWFAPNAWAAAIRGTAGLIVAIGIYYATKGAVGVTGGIELQAIRGWAGPAFVAGPTASLVAYQARRAAWWSLPLALGFPMLMVIEAHLRPTGPDYLRPMSQYVVYGMAAVIAIILLFRTWRRYGLTKKAGNS